MNQFAAQNRPLPDIGSGREHKWCERRGGDRRLGDDPSYFGYFALEGLERRKGERRRVCR